MELFRGIPDEDGPVDPVVLRKWEEFRTNITNGRERSLFSCLEDQTYSAINDFANCHLFCPVCNWGYEEICLISQILNAIIKTTT